VTRRRALAGLVGLLAAGLVFALLAAPPQPAAAAPERSHDVFAGIGLSPRVDDADSLIERFPLKHYQLDVNVEAGTLDFGGHMEELLHSAAGLVWNLARLLTVGAITLFTWAFSFDLLDPASGVLDPVAQAARELHEHTLGQAWMVAAITLAGLWGIWNALVRRRYAETAGALGVSVLFALAALLLVLSPGRVIEPASAASNAMSNAFLEVGTVGSGTAGSAKAELADRLFKAFVFDPFVVLNWGGLEHCVDGAGEPVPRSGRCLSHVAPRGGEGGYAQFWLRYGVGTPQRKAEFASLNAGKVTEDGEPGGVGGVLDDVGDVALGEDDQAKADPGQFDGRVISSADIPGVDMQQKGAGAERLALALLILVGNLGVVILLGALALGIFLAQVLALLLLAFAPVALVAGIFPGRGHDLFQAWAKRLLEAVVRKAIYSLILAVLLAVSSALILATGEVPWILAFAFQAAFFWMVFLGRKQLTEKLTGVRSEGGQKLRDLYFGQKLARGAATAPLRTAAAGAGVLGGAATLGVASTGWAARRTERLARSEARQDRVEERLDGLRARADQGLQHDFAHQRDAHQHTSRRLAGLAALDAKGEQRTPEETARRDALQAELTGVDRAEHAARGHGLAQREEWLKQTGKPYTRGELHQAMDALARDDQRAAAEPVAQRPASPALTVARSNGSDPGPAALATTMRGEGAGRTPRPRPAGGGPEQRRGGGEVAEELAEVRRRLAAARHQDVEHDAAAPPRARRLRPRLPFSRPPRSD
jgi:hypothetical protein